MHWQGPPGARMELRLRARRPQRRQLWSLLLLLLLVVAGAAQQGGGGGSSGSAVWSDGRCASGSAASQGALLPSRGRVALVTGAAGFIGSHVAEYCANQLGMRVIAVDDLSGGYRSNLPRETEAGSSGGSIRFVQGDVRDAEFLAELFRAHRIDYVYHLAAFAAEGLSHFIRSFIYRNNLVGSTELLNVAVKHNVSCFTFTSSIAVYGASQPPPMVEQTDPVPEDPYGISKYAFELDLKSAHRLFGLDYVIFRPHNVYGPR
jgi:UDP-glucose 4-epimerase